MYLKYYLKYMYFKILPITGSHNYPTSIPSKLHLSSVSSKHSLFHPSLLLLGYRHHPLTLLIHNSLSLSLRLKTYVFHKSYPRSFTSSSRNAFTDYCPNCFF